MNNKVVMGAVAAAAVVVVGYMFLGGGSSEAICETESHVFQMNKQISAHIDSLSDAEQDKALETLQRIGGSMRPSTPIPEQCATIKEALAEFGITPRVIDLGI